MLSDREFIEKCHKMAEAASSDIADISFQFRKTQAKLETLVALQQELLMKMERLIDAVYKLA